MELGFEYFTGLQADGLFNEPAGVTAFRAREAFGFNLYLTVGSDDDFDDF